MRAIMLAIVCLCAYSAVGQDADSAFCDTIDGAIAEFRNLSRFDSPGSTNSSLGGDYAVHRVPQATKLPGAAECTAYVYGGTVFYTCRWTGTNPRSTFVDFGTQLDGCLTERGYSRPWEGETLEGPLTAGVRTREGQGYFAQFWRGGRDGRYGVILKAYKMSAKGVFLQMRFYDPNFLDKAHQVWDWEADYISVRASRVLGKSASYSSRNPFASARPGAQKEKEAADLWNNAGENPGEFPDRTVGHYELP